VSPAEQVIVDLQALKAERRIRHAFLDGMVVVEAHGDHFRKVGGLWWREPDLLAKTRPDLLAARLDLEDPATKGCLVALARELAGEPDASPHRVEDSEHWEMAAGPRVGCADTEGAAIAELIGALRTEVLPDRGR
jgi:hypothetical protein